jgi:hypothetical protein
VSGLLPSDGLPEPLPRGERILWQGRPAAWPLTVEAFRFNWIAGYFAVLFGWRLLSALADGDGAVQAVTYAAWIVPVGGTALALLAFFGWASARTTLYTVTDRRVVLRIGIALPVTVNLPYTVVEAAAVKRRRDGSGDIAFRLTPETRTAYAVLWPHARPWRYGRPEPALRAVANVDGVASRIAEALERIDAPAIIAAASPDHGRVARRGAAGFVTAAE